MTASDSDYNQANASNQESEAHLNLAEQANSAERTRVAFEKTLTALIGADIVKLLDLQVTIANDGIPVAQGLAFGHVITVRHELEPGQEENYIVVDGEEGKFHHDVSGEELKTLLAQIYASHENPAG